MDNPAAKQAVILYDAPPGNPSLSLLAELVGQDQLGALYLTASTQAYNVSFNTDFFAFINGVEFFDV